MGWVPAGLARRDYDRDAGMNNRPRPRTVFTNGCFDILHVGHIKLLQYARAQGDRLVVGLNSDDSIRRLKGPDRPVFAQYSRAAVLRELRCVDAVHIFSEDTPLELIKLIQPSVLVKGREYVDTEIVGAAEVISWGGFVVLPPMIEGFSTTKALEVLNRKITFDDTSTGTVPQP